MAVTPSNIPGNGGTSRVTSLQDALNFQLPDPWANRSQPEAPKPHGWKGLVAGTLNFAPIKYGVLKPLELLAVPKNAIVSGLAEFRDAVDGNPNTKASFGDWRKQTLDPSYGFGTAFHPFGNSKWGNRVSGLLGDVLLDPLMYVSAGGHLFDRATLEVADYAGRELLARKAFGAFLAADATIEEAGAKAAQILQEGVPAARNLLSKAEQEAVGLAESGLYMFRGKYIRSIRIPGTAAVGDAMTSVGSKARLAFGSTAVGKWFQKATMAGEESIAAARLAILRGEIPNEKVGLALYSIASTDSRRAAQSAAALFAEDNVKSLLAKHKIASDPVLAKQVVDALEDPKLYEAASSSVKAAVGDVRKFLNDTHRQLSDALVQVDRGAAPKYLDNYIQHQLTPEAWDHLLKNRAALTETLDALGIKEMNPTAMRFSRRLVEGSDFFGHILGADELTIAKLNEIARREGRFVGDFFEQDANKILSRYGGRWIDDMGTAASLKYMNDNGVLKPLLFSEEISQSFLDETVGKLAKANTKLEAAVSAFGQSGADLEKGLIGFRDALRVEAGKADVALAAEVSKKGATVEKALKELETLAASLAKTTEMLSVARGEYDGIFAEGEVLANLLDKSVAADVTKVDEAVAQLNSFISLQAQRGRQWQANADELIAETERNLADVTAAYQQLQESSRNSRRLAEWLNSNWKQITAGELKDPSSEEAFKKLVNLINERGLVEKGGGLKGLPGAWFNQKSFREDVLFGWWKEAHGKTELTRSLGPMAEVGPLYPSAEAQAVGRMFGPTFRIGTLKEMDFNKAKAAFDEALSSGSVAGAHDASAVLASNLLMVYGQISDMPDHIRTLFDEWVTHTETLRKLRDWERTVADAWRTRATTKVERSLVQLRNTNEQLAGLAERAMTKQHYYSLLEDDIRAATEAFDALVADATANGKKLTEYSKVEVELPSARWMRDNGIYYTPDGEKVQRLTWMTRNDIRRATSDLRKMREELDMAWAMAVTDGYGNITVLDAVEDVVFGGRTFTGKSLAESEMSSLTGLPKVPESEAFDAGFSVLEGSGRPGNPLGSFNPNDPQALYTGVDLTEGKLARAEEQLPKVTAREARDRAKGARVRDIYVEEKTPAGVNKSGERISTTRWVLGSAPVLGDSAAEMRRIAVNRIEILSNEARVARAYEAMVASARAEGVVLDPELTMNFLWDAHMRGRVEMHGANAANATKRYADVVGVRSRMQARLDDMVGVGKGAATVEDYRKAAEELAAVAGLHGGGKEVEIARNLFDAENAVVEAKRAGRGVEAAGKRYQEARKAATDWFRATNPGAGRFNLVQVKEQLSPHYLRVTDQKSWDSFASSVERTFFERERSARNLHAATGQQFVSRRNEAKLQMLSADIAALEKQKVLHDEIRKVLTPDVVAKLQKRAVADQELKSLLHRASLIDYREVTDKAREQARVLANTYEAFTKSSVYMQAKQDSSLRRVLDRLAVVDGETLTADEWRQMGFLQPEVWDAEASKLRVAQFDAVTANGERAYRFDPHSGGYVEVSSADGFQFGDTVYRKVSEDRWVPAEESMHVQELTKSHDLLSEAIDAWAVARQGSQESGVLARSAEASRLSEIRDLAQTEVNRFEVMMRHGAQREIPQDVLEERRRLSAWYADFRFRSENASGAGLSGQYPNDVDALGKAAPAERAEARRVAKRLADIDNEWFRDSVFTPSRHELLAYENNKLIVTRIDEQLAELNGSGMTEGQKIIRRAKDRVEFAATSEGRLKELQSQRRVVEFQLSFAANPYSDPKSLTIIYPKAWEAADTQLTDINSQIAVLQSRLEDAVAGPALRGKSLQRVKAQFSDANRAVENLNSRYDQALAEKAKAEYRRDSWASVFESETAAGDSKRAALAHRKRLVAVEDVQRQQDIADAVQRQLDDAVAWQREALSQMQEEVWLAAPAAPGNNEFVGELLSSVNKRRNDRYYSGIEDLIAELDQKVAERDALLPQIHAAKEANPPTTELTEEGAKRWRVVRHDDEPRMPTWERMDTVSSFEPVGQMPMPDPSKVPSVTFTKQEWDSLYSHGFESPIPTDKDVAGSLVARHQEAVAKAVKAKERLDAVIEDAKPKVAFAKKKLNALKKVGAGPNDAEYVALWEQRLASLDAGVEIARRAHRTALDAAEALDPKVAVRAQTKMRQLMSHVDSRVIDSSAFDSAVGSVLGERAGVASAVAEERRALLAAGWDGSASSQTLAHGEKLRSESALATASSERRSVSSVVWRRAHSDAIAKHAEIVSEIRNGGKWHESMFAGAADTVAGSSISKDAKDLFITDPSLALEQMRSAKASLAEKGQARADLQRVLGERSGRKPAGTIYDDELSTLATLRATAVRERDTAAKFAGQGDALALSKTVSRQEELKTEIQNLRTKLSGVSDQAELDKINSKLAAKAQEAATLEKRAAKLKEKLDAQQALRDSQGFTGEGQKSRLAEVAARKKALEKQIDDLRKVVDTKTKAAQPAIDKARKKIADKLAEVAKLDAKEAELRAKVAEQRGVLNAAAAIQPSEVAALERSAVAEANLVLVQDLLDAHQFAVGTRDQFYKGRKILVDWGGDIKARSIEDVRQTINKGTRAERALADGFEEVNNRGVGQVVRKPLTAERRAALEAVAEKGKAYRTAMEQATLSDVEAGRLSQLARDMQSWMSGGMTILDGNADAARTLGGAVPKEEKALQAVVLQHLNAEAKMLQAQSEVRALEERLTNPDFWVKDVKPLLEDGFASLESWGLPNTQTDMWVKEFFDNFKRTEDPAVAQALSKFLGWYTKRFKAYAIASPGFHVRNALDNTFRVFSAGAEASNMFEGAAMFEKWVSARHAGNVEKFFEGLGERRQQFELALNMYHGAGSGQGAQGLAELLSTVKLKKIDENFWLRANRNLTERVEGSARFMLAYDSAVKGMDVEMGMRRVRRYLFDYAPEGRNNLDRSMRHVVPFWTYMSKNLPFQIVNRWQNPQAYILLNDILRNVTGGDGMGMPAYMREGGAVDLGGGNALALDMGQNRIAEQLNMLQDPVRLLKDVNPAIRLPMELIGNRKYYNNQPFSKASKQIPGGPAAPLIENLLSMLGLTETAGAALTPNSPTPGSTVTSSKAAYALMNSLPPLAMLERLAPATDQYQANQGNSWLGWLGVPVRHYTPDQQQQNRQQVQDELRKALAAGRAK